MKRRKRIYTFEGGNGGFIKIYLVPKKLRTDKYKVDGIQMEWYSSKESRINTLDMKDWEALVIVQGLIRALLVKRGIR